MDFKGIFPILVTPFNEDESVDLQSVGRLVGFMRKIGTQGVTILGVLGEANRISEQERSEIIKTAVSESGNMPVIVGTSATGTKLACKYASMAEALGANAIMVTPHQEQVPSNDRLLHYYSTIANNTSLPIVMQDHPASSNVHMSVEIIEEIIHNVPSIKCIKQEAVPTASKIRQIKLALKNRKISILTGLGSLYGFYDLRAGSDGFNTGFAFPEVLSAIYKAASDEQWTLAYNIYQKFLPLIVYEQQPGVGIRKEILRLRGAIRSNAVRHPGKSVDQQTQITIEYLMDRVFENMDITNPVAI